MGLLWWTILGLAIGLIVMAPITRMLLLRAEKRARQAEGRARDAERLAELGSLTGGLAHEIKNPLSTIGLNAQLLAEGLRETHMPDEERERLVRRLEALKREAERLRDILTDFLKFAGRMKLDLQTRDLVRIVDELSDFYHPQCAGAGVVLRTQLPASAVNARVDETLLKQAILNLMINATQAMAATGFSNRAADERGSNAGARGELILRVDQNEREAAIHVIDTGPGIAADHAEQIFHPYVSFKSGGTGLGLPTARRIVEEHGGRLTVDSEPGRGSDFTVRLPLDA